MKNKTVIHCVNSFSSLAGGVGFAIRALVEQVPGVNHVIYALRDSAPILDVRRASVHLFKRTGPYQLSYSRGLEAALLSATEQDPDVIIHAHGLWSGLGRSLDVMRRRVPGAKYLLSLHGALSPRALERRRVVKRAMGLMWENRVLTNAGTVHCLTAVEEEFARAYREELKTFVLPHAIDFKYPQEALESQWERRATNVKELLYIGRIHETKGLSILIDVLSAGAGSSSPDRFRLKIAGIGEPGALAQLKRQIAASKAQIEFVGPAFGEAKQILFSRAHGLVLPSQTEGLPMTLMEAASHGLPLFVTKECNVDWVQGETAGAMAPFGAEGVQDLVDAFTEASVDSLRTMGLNSAAAARKRYSSEIVSGRWRKLYDSL